MFHSELAGFPEGVPVRARGISARVGPVFGGRSLRLHRIPVLRAATVVRAIVLRVAQVERRGAEAIRRELREQRPRREPDLRDRRTRGRENRRGPGACRGWRPVDRRR